MMNTGNSGAQGQWVSVKIRCGLGNRLFQTAAAMGIAERLGRPFVFLLPRMTEFHHGDWKFFLSLFPEVPIIESAAGWEEVSEEKISSLETIKAPLVLRGDFQDLSFFPRSFRIPLTPADPIAQTSWAIHFRFGDYCKLPHHQLPLGPYYRQMIDTHIPTKQTLITLFSDEPQKLKSVREELRLIGYSRVLICQETCVKETMRHFAAHQGGSICSNSTFAWWCAWLAWQTSEKKTYRAYFPTPWVRGHEEPKIFTLPFTQAVQLETLPLTPSLHSFSYTC